MGKRIKRKVINYKKTYVYANYSGSSRQTETLECGHEVRNKGSVGRASFRFCHECEEYRRGAKYYENGVLTFWNPETEMPISIPYKRGLVPKIDESLDNGYEGRITVYSNAA